MSEQKDQPENQVDEQAEAKLDEATEAPGQDTKAESESESTESASDELIAAQEEIAKLKDAFLRAKAEEDNVRRRAEKEVASSRKFAVEGFAKELLNVYDSLKLAVAVEIDEGADDSVKSVKEGVDITLKQLQTALTKFSVTEIAPEVGDKLDPNLHQAMSMVESEEVDSGCILNVIQSGFQIHDRLLRPAMVVVSK